MTRDDQRGKPPTGTDTGDPRKDADTPDVPTEQAANDLRGDDEIRRELGAGDGDDPPPHDDDEPLRDR